MERGIYRALALVLSTVLLVSCSQDKDQSPSQINPARFERPASSDAHIVWQRATLAFPVRGSVGSMITANDANLQIFNFAGTAAGTKWPVMVLLAGCGTGYSSRLLKALAEQGFVVVVLDSRARIHRPLDCRPDEKLHVRAARTMRDKQIEVSHALQQLAGRNWADVNNVFVVGVGDMSPAVARLPSHQVKGRVLAEWDCGGSSDVQGLRDADSGPVFVTTSARVPALDGGCANYMINAANSQILTLPNTYPIEILSEPIIFTQLLKFLDAQIFR
jgi:dienelactone hydrolase